MSTLRQEMLKQAEKRFAGLPKSQRKSLAKVVVDRHVAKVRGEIREGKIYVEK